MPDSPEKPVTSNKVNINITDRLLVIIFFVVGAILSVVTILALRQSVENTGKISDAVEISRFNSEAGSFCILRVSGQINTGEIPYTNESLEKAVNTCFIQKAAGTLPQVSTTTTTTETNTTVTLPVTNNNN